MAIPASVLAPPCPKCGDETRRRQVRRGPRAGLEMWGCAAFPDCDGAINIDPPAPDPEGPEDVAAPIISGTPGGAYAQRRADEERRRRMLMLRAMAPVLTVFGIASMVFAWLVSASGGPVASSISVSLVFILYAFGLTRLPVDGLFWVKGVEGEREAARYLEPLLDAGFVLLYNRRIPGLKADIDSIAIGPTGVFAIETKKWSGKVEVLPTKLFVGDNDRSWVVQQVYREAFAVQVALNEELTKHRVMVTPVICAVGGVKTINKTVSGVRVCDAKGLAKVIASGEPVLDDQSVQRLARLADRFLPLPYEWQL